MAREKRVGIASKMTTKGQAQHPQGGHMDAQLEDVLDAYAAAEPGPGNATLKEWIREYPQYARELMEFTAQWQLLEWADDGPGGDGEPSREVVSDEDPHFLRGMSAAQSAFYELRAKRQREQEAAIPTAQPATTTNEAPISSLRDAAKRINLSYAELRERSGLSDALLQKLNRRLIDPITIPSRVLSNLATVLQYDPAAVAAYTRLPPAFAAGAQHRASQAPALAENREDFFTAVQNDLTLPVARKEELLGLPRPPVDTTRVQRRGNAE
jgi:hypothetical protein